MKPRRHNPAAYRSGLESKVGAQLNALGVEFKFEADKLVYYKKCRSSSCRDCGSKEVFQKHTYTPDFVIGPSKYIETKGIFSPTDRKKMQLIKEQFPNVTIYLLFQRNNRINEKGEKYSDWCDQNEYIYAFGEVPKSWVV